MKEKITDYRLEKAATISSLENKVCANLKEGWELYGTLVIDTAAGEEDYMYYQAMVRVIK